MYDSYCCRCRTAIKVIDSGESDTAMCVLCFRYEYYNIRTERNIFGLMAAFFGFTTLYLLLKN